MEEIRCRKPGVVMQTQTSGVKTSLRVHPMSLVIGAFALLAMLLPGGQAIGDGQDALFIDTNGNVGIGTNQPRAKLDVQGTVNAVKFTGDGSDLKVANATLAALRKALDMLVPIGTIMA